MFRPFIEVLWFDAQKCACNSQVFIVTKLFNIVVIEWNLLNNKLSTCS